MTISKEALLKKFHEKPKTILFIWTSWCGASQSVLETIYIPLSDSLSGRFVDANIILLCASSGQDEKVAKLSELHCIQSYYMENPGSGIALSDRSQIRKFLTDNFGKEDRKKITENNFNFAIPITVLVDNKGKILNPRAPQNVSLLMEMISE